MKSGLWKQWKREKGKEQDDVVCISAKCVFSEKFMRSARRVKVQFSSVHSKLSLKVIFYPGRNVEEINNISIVIIIRGLFFLQGSGGGLVCRAFRVVVVVVVVVSFRRRCRILLEALLQQRHNSAAAKRVVVVVGGG